MCRHWRSIALECATLWTNIAFSTSMLSTIRCARLFLSRSKNAALSVYVWDSGHAENLKIARSSKKLLKTISTQAHRISTCQLSSPSPDFWRCWVAPAPNLRKLLLQGHGPEVPPVFRGEFPLLEALFSQYCTTWPLGNYATLTHVELRNHSHHTSLTSLLDTLRGCVVLEGLVLDGYAFVVQEPPLLTPICLPRLKQIDLQTSDSALILGHLEVPSLRGPVVILNSTSRRHILQALPANQHNTPYLQGITSLHVDLSTRSSYHCVAGFRGDGSTAVYLGIYGMSSRERSSWAQLSFTAIAFFSPFFNIRTISLVTDAPAVPWELWLPNLACVEELTASCPRPDGLLAALLASSPENALPLLRNLTVYRRGRYSVVDHTALMQFVLHRYRIARPLRQLRLNREEWGWIQRLDETWVLLAQSQGKCRVSTTTRNSLIYS